MKRWIILFFAVALSFAAVLFSLLPSSPDSLMALDDGGAWLTESCENGYYLYRLNPEGRIDYANWNPVRGGRESAVAGLVAGEGCIYVLNRLYPAGDSVSNGWEIVEHDIAGGQSKLVYSGRDSQLSNPMSLTFSGNLLYLSGWQDHSESAVVLAFDPAAEDLEAQEIESVPMPLPVFMQYARDTLYGGSRAGEFFRYRQGTRIASSEEIRPSGISATANTVWLFDSVSSKAYILDGGDYKEGFQLGENSFAITGAADSSGNEYCLVAGRDSSFHFVCRNALGEHQYRFRQTFSTVAAAAARVLSSPLLLIPIMTAVSGLLVILLLHLRRMLMKLVVLLVVTGVLTSCFAAFFSSVFFSGQLSTVYREEAARITTSYLESLPVGFTSRISADSASDRDLQAIDSVITPRVITVNGKGHFVFTDILQYDEDGTLRILYSGKTMRGTAAFSAYPHVAAPDGFPRSDEILREGGRSYAANVVSANSIIFVTMLDASGLAFQTNNFFWQIWIILCGVFTVLILFIGISGSLAMRSLGILKTGMERVSDGDYEANAITDGNNEIGDMERSLQELSLSLSIRDYETKNLIDSFYRFVPRNIETLLGRASVSEVVCGDNAELCGCVGIVSVSNRGSALEEMDNTRYLWFVSYCFDCLRDGAAADHGQFLSAGFDLSATPIYFDQNADNGVLFGLHLMGSEADKQEDAGPEPRFFLLLHHTTALLGVAGNEHRAFLFLSSSELTFLQSYSDDLQSLGCSIVVTESFMRRVSPGKFSSRYIGFISSPDEQYSCKLFEILDLYSDQERARCLQYDKKMQDAINLFYKNNFYLARNIFSSILKMRPDDGVARWYTFACENYFNSDDLSNIRYNLFGLKE